MSPRAATPATPSSGGLGSLLLPAVVGLMALGIVAVLVAAPDRPFAVLIPIGLVTSVYVASTVPLRWSASVLLALLLTLDETKESSGWQTPLADLGDLLSYKLDESANIPGLVISGTELILLFLLGVWLYRRATRSTIDSSPPAPGATVVRDFILLYLVGIIVSWGWGMARGLPSAPWKIRYFLDPLLLYLLFVAAYQGGRDFRQVGRIIVGAACYRAGLAILIQRIAIAETGGKLATATSHGDSILFASALVLLFVDAAEWPARGKVLRAALLVPLILVGARENGRRLVWVMLALSFLAVFLVAPMRGWKRALTRAVLVASPILLLYVGVGWGRGGALFVPLQTLRSVSDTSVDRSAYWREVENWNIAMTMRDQPFLGLGLGGEYTEFRKNDDISGSYKDFRAWPHNTILGTMLLLGVFCFTAVWSFYALVVFLSVRSFRAAVVPADRVVALCCLGTMVACFMLAWGDTGAHYPQFKVFTAIAAAAASKLAAATGAWPASRSPSVDRSLSGDEPLLRF